MSVAFYVKCRPQGCDAWPLVREHGRVFIGYPPWRSARGPLELGFHALLADLSKEPFTWDPRLAGVQRGYAQQVAANRKLVAQVDKGSLVLVPRLGEGVCHVGTITGAFEVVDRPQWGDVYLALRQAARLEVGDPMDHIADVVQGWPVHWTERPIPFPFIPRWLSGAFLSRRTAGLIHNRPDGEVTAYDVLRGLMERDRWPTREATGDVVEIERRLLDLVSPSILEHLVCELLQLEEPGTMWVHCGGAGDCGADGLGFDAEGGLVGILQCKWRWDGSVTSITASLLPGNDEVGRATPRVFVAVLHGAAAAQGAVDEKVTLITASWIAQRLVEHRDRVAFAMTVGIEALR